MAQDHNNEDAGKLPFISGTKRVIFELLAGGNEMYGLEMVQASGNRLKRGTIYVTLQRMEEEKLVESREEPRPMPEVGIPRRVYRLTGYGERVYAAYELATRAFSLPDFEPGGMLA